MNQAKELAEELSYQDIQKMIEQMLGKRSIDFGAYVTSLLQGKLPFSLEEMLHTLLQYVMADFLEQKRMLLSIIIIAVMGAVFTSFSKLLQGKQVAEMAFYTVYVLFFSILLTVFTKMTAIAGDTLTKLLDFMKVLSPAYFSAMTFSQGSLSSGVYYEFTMAMITMADFVLVKFALPGIHIYFLLCIANQLSERELFTQMAKLLQDVIKFVMKSMFGIMMGINVVQGLVLPVTAQMQNSAVVRLSGSIPGIGNTISNVAGTILCAGTLVKNAVGVAGVIVVILFCGVPLLRLLVDKFLFCLLNAFLEPISDKRIISCFGAVAESIQMLIYAVFVGSMLFVVSIAIMSAMTR